jgi:hypothetical protein
MAGSIIASKTRETGAAMTVENRRRLTAAMKTPCFEFR